MVVGLFCNLCNTMSIRKRAFQQGVLDAFVPPFVQPVPPQPQKWLPEESDIQDDTENLCNDWYALGVYISGAVEEHERNLAETR